MVDTKAIIYVDTDIIFWGPIEEIWAYFNEFTPPQVGALAPRVGWNFEVSLDNPNYIQQQNGRMTQVNSGVSIPSG